VQLIGFHLINFTAQVDYVGAAQTSGVSTHSPAPPSASASASVSASISAPSPSGLSLDDSSIPPFHPAPSVRSIIIRKRLHDEEDELQVPFIMRNYGPLPEPWVTPERRVIDSFFRGL
jgi:hypothetical protein